MGDTARRLAVRDPRRARLLAFAGVLAVLVALAGGALTFGDAEAQQAPARRRASQQSRSTLAQTSRKATTGATSYALYSRDEPGAINTRVTPVGHTARSYTDTGRTNGTTYYYAVRSVSGGIESAPADRERDAPRAFVHVLERGRAGELLPRARQPGRPRMARARTTAASRATHRRRA